MRRRSRRRSSIFYTHFTCAHRWRSLSLIFLMLCVRGRQRKMRCAHLSLKKGCWPAWSIRQGATAWANCRTSNYKSMQSAANGTWENCRGRKAEKKPTPYPLLRKALFDEHATGSENATGWKCVHLSSWWWICLAFTKLLTSEGKMLLKS